MRAVTWLDTNTNTERLVERVEYDIYGKATFTNWGADRTFGTGDDATSTTSLVGNPFLFTGQTYDNETGNYYYRHRYYSANTGRFLSQDPLGYVDGANQYQHVFSSPTNYSDPLGLTHDDGGLSGGGGAGGGGGSPRPRGSDDFSPTMYFIDQFFFGKMPPRPKYNPGNKPRGGGSGKSGASGPAGCGCEKGGAGAAQPSQPPYEPGKNPFKGWGGNAADYTDEQLNKAREYLEKLGVPVPSQVEDCIGIAAGLADLLRVGEGVGEALDSGDWLDAAMAVVDDVNRAAQIALLVATAGEMAAKRPATPECQRPGATCFTAGTLVLTSHGYKAIEELRVGERVLTSGADDDGPTSVTADWRLVKLRMSNPTCRWDVIELELLRRADWLEGMGWKAGANVRVSLTEMGVSGPVRIDSVGPCPEIEQGPGRVILGTVTHYNGFVVELTVDGLDKPLEPTNTHKLWSETHGGWTEAGDLQAGDVLRTKGGTATVLEVKQKSGVYRVFNIEVESVHDYYVSPLKVLSHNGPCPAPQSGGEQCPRREGPRPRPESIEDADANSAAIKKTNKEFQTGRQDSFRQKMINEMKGKRTK